MKLLESRLAVAAPLIPALYLLITTLPPLFFSLLAAMAILRAQYEFYKLYYPEKTLYDPSPPSLPSQGQRALRGSHPLKGRGKEGGTGFKCDSSNVAICFGLACGFSLLCLLYLKADWMGHFFIFILLAILIFYLFFYRQIQLALLDCAVLALGVFYLAGFLGHLILIRQRPDGDAYILFLLIVVWGNDAGAYYVGRSVGGKKLYPAISPNKTVSGSIGGFIVGVLLGLAVKVSLLPALPFLDVILLSLLLVLAGQVGDLVESMLKRSAGVKDSSRFIPAHGGLLDKLDGVAFAAPLLYYCMVWMQPL
jgi:phosphatidate cytidylyltransferase